MDLNRHFSKIFRWPKGHEKVLNIRVVQSRPQWDYVSAIPSECLSSKKKKKKKKTDNRCLSGCREKRTFVQGWWECRLVQSLWETLDVCKNKQNHYVEEISAPPCPFFLQHYSQQLRYGNKLCTHWEMNKENVVYIETMEYATAVKRRKFCHL